MKISIYTVVVAIVSTASRARAHENKVILWGDMPYQGESDDVFDDVDTVTACTGTSYGVIYSDMIDSVNGEGADFALHTGDVKGGSSPCTDKFYNRFEDMSNAINVPSLLTLGDNGWTDCHRTAAGGFDPLGRLELMRERFYAPSISGQDVPNVMGGTEGAGQILMTTQANKGYPENQRFVYNGVMYVLAHVTGSNNALYDSGCPATLAAVSPTACDEAFEEYEERNKAVNQWLTNSFALARNPDVSAVVVVIQANVRFDNIRTGFVDFWDTITDLSSKYEGETYLVYGDSHRFTETPNPAGSDIVMAVQVPGSADVGYVLATVNPHASPVVTFEHVDINTCVDNNA